MAPKFEIIDPVSRPGWDGMLLSHKKHSFFHSSAWAKVLSETYGYKPLYFSLLEGEKLSALIPVMEIRSILTGRRGVSLPFSDYCEPIGSSREQLEELLKRVRAYGEKAGWRFLELRGGRPLVRNSGPSASFLLHSIQLSGQLSGRPSGDERHVFSRFRESTKRNILKAAGSGLKAGVHRSAEAVGEFYRLNCMTRKLHGLPPQPYIFFKKVLEHVISQGLGFVVLASYKGVNVAGAVYFHFGERAIYKYGASDRSYQHLRANNLVMWEAIKWCSGSGFKSFCLGRTAADHKGLIQFKNGWATEESPLEYYRYGVSKKAPAGEGPVSSKVQRVLKKTPIPLSRMIGSALYRHFG